MFSTGYPRVFLVLPEPKGVSLKWEGQKWLLGPVLPQPHAGSQLTSWQAQEGRSFPLFQKKSPFHALHQGLLVPPEDRAAPW